MACGLETQMGRSPVTLTVTLHVVQAVTFAR
jgi:hypothetical protein